MYISCKWHNHGRIFHLIHKWSSYRRSKGVVCKRRVRNLRVLLEFYLSQKLGMQKLVFKIMIIIIVKYFPLRSKTMRGSGGTYL